MCPARRTGSFKFWRHSSALESRTRPSTRDPPGRIRLPMTKPPSTWPACSRTIAPRNLALSITTSQPLARGAEIAGCRCLLPAWSSRNRGGPRWRQVRSTFHFADASLPRHTAPWCNLDRRHGSSFRPVPGLVFKTSGRRGCARRWVRPPRASARRLSEEPQSGWSWRMERETRLELATNSVEGCDSTFELLPLEGVALPL